MLQDMPVFFISFSAIIGLMIGSFLNVVIYRLPEMMKRNWLQQCAELHAETAKVLPAFNLITPRSVCIYCGHKITAWENIPIVSYLVLQGRCSQCRACISLRYPIVEAVTALMSGFIAWYYGYGLITIAVLIFVCAVTVAIISSSNP